MVILKCYYNFDLKEYVIKYVFMVHLLLRWMLNAVYKLK